MNKRLEILYKQAFLYGYMITFAATELRVKHTLRFGFFVSHLNNVEDRA